VKSELVAFDFNFQLAEAGDKIDSAVVPLPEGRKKVTLGRLTIKSVSPDSTGSCVAVTFLPTVLPKGVEPSNDPMIAARVAPYAVSLGRRLTEGAKQ
jgi:catalase